jgi:hypothetical protein
MPGGQQHDVVHPDAVGAVGLVGSAASTRQEASASWPASARVHERDAVAEVAQAALEVQQLGWFRMSRISRR